MTVTAGMQLSPTPRRIMVDDTDSRIIYSSNFFTDDTGGQDGNGNFGPTFGSSLHGTNGNGSFQFTFSGTQIFVYGTTSGNKRDPSWECFIDGISIGQNPLSFPENNWVICSSNILVDGPHNLTVSAASNGHTFWFDYLQYTPSTNVPLENALIRVDCTDAALGYYSVWTESNTVYMTTTAGSGAVFNFVGTQLQWYGLIPTEAPHAPSLAAFSIDEGVGTGFALRGLPSLSSHSQHNQLIFQTSKLPYGAHTINVTLQMNSNSTPLTLQYLLVQNGTETQGANGTAQTTTLVPTVASTSYSASGAAKKTNIGNIVGSVIGSLLFLLSIVAAYLFFQYYKRKRANELDVKDTIPIPFHPQPRPSVEPVNASSRSSFSRVADNPFSQPLQNDLVPSHRRRQSHGRRKYTTLPEGSSSHAVTHERIEGIDGSTPYYGGYQTWGQTKAIEAKSHKHGQRDSYI